MDYSVVLFDLKTEGAPSEKPLMLQPVLFCPVLTWVCQELRACGAQRFFAVCDADAREEVLAAAEGFDLTCVDSAEEALAQVQGGVIAVPGAVVPAAGEPSRAVYAADAGELRARLGEGRTLADCPAEASGILPLWQSPSAAPAFLPVADAGELQAAMPRCRELLMRRLAHSGVTVIDPQNTYVDPRCTVAPGVTILPGTILRGRTAIGAGCEIGPNAMLTDCAVGEETTINASQLNDSTVGSHTHRRSVCLCPAALLHRRPLPRGRFRRDEELLHRRRHEDQPPHLCRRQRRRRAGELRLRYGHDQLRRRTRSSAAPSATMCSSAATRTSSRPSRWATACYTAAGSTVTDDVPAGALAIARTRQTNKEGWAARLRKSWGKK